MTTTQLCTLPEELLSNILHLLPTKDLLRTVPVCRRLQQTVQGILARRLRGIELLEGHNLVFGCSIPARRNISPYQHCLHKGLTVPTVNTSQNLSDIYSRFVPYAPSNHYASALESNDATLHPVSTTVSLDETEYFTQLCANSVLVKMCTKQGLFTSLVRVFEDTSFRLRRNDLRNSARTKVPWTVWLDGHHNVGVKMRIQERARQVDWVPMMANDSDEDEDSPVSYVVEYEEVLVRTEYLVVVLETAEGQSAKDGVIVGKC